MIRELRLLLGDDFDLEIVMFNPGPAAPDMGLFETLGTVLRELDPEGIAVPLVMSGVTDARFFSRLGIQTYGFTPLKLPEDFNFIRTIHAADERVPVDALDFGAQAIFKAMQRFR
jgi:acetylornithine deacetylase/succinyl-diaminopimelate desuccinylase-like protein